MRNSNACEKRHRTFFVNISGEWAFPPLCDLAWQQTGRHIHPVATWNKPQLHTAAYQIYACIKQKQYSKHRMQLFQYYSHHWRMGENNAYYRPDIQNQQSKVKLLPVSYWSSISDILHKVIMWNQRWKHVRRRRWANGPPLGQWATADPPLGVRSFTWVSWRVDGTADEDYVLGEWGVKRTHWHRVSAEHQQNPLQIIFRQNDRTVLTFDVFIDGFEGSPRLFVCKWI